MKRQLIQFLSIWVFLLCLGPSIQAQVVFPPDFEQTVRRDYAQLSDPEETFDAYFSYRKTAFIDKYNIEHRLAGAYEPCQGNHTPCGNGDFESGLDTNEWSGAYGVYANYPNALTDGFSPLNLALSNSNARQTLVGVGNDPLTGISQVAPGGSTQAIRLGNTAVGRGVELISKRFTVMPGQTIIGFQYAVVLQKPTGHANGNQPKFFVRVIDCADGSELRDVCNLGNNSNMVIADEDNPFFMSTTYDDDELKYTDWMCAQINLSQHVGKTVTIQFINMDCLLGQHFGYTYLDNVCVTTNCKTGDVRLRGVPACGPGRICVDFNLPESNGTTGTAQIDLQIYQGGSLIHTMQSPSFIAGSNYCFYVDPAQIPGINTNLAGYDFAIVGNFGINGISLAPITIGNPPDGQTAGQNNDVGISCITQCCPGRNLIKNPGFELGNQSFGTAYIHQPSISLSSVNTGRYAVMTSAQGLQVSPTWDVNCSTNGNHLYVNGATGLTGSRVAWYQNVTVERGKIYKFCVDMKNLPQCGFDIKPIVSVQFSVPGFDITNQVIDVPSGNCNWQSVNQVLTMPAGTGQFSMSIRILLDETGIGDGNDLAIDNLTLVEIQQTPLNEVLFNIPYINVTPTSFGLSGEPLAPLGEGCGYFWEVSEIDANGNNIPGTTVTNPSQWWGQFPNTFNGYNGSSTLVGNMPGVFDISKSYRIIYGRWCECTGWNSYAHELIPNPRATITEPMLIIKKENYPVSVDKIAAAIRQLKAQSAVKQKSNAAMEKSQVNRAVAETQRVKEMRVYPNPADDQLTVILPESPAQSVITVYNSLGAEMARIPVEKNAQKKLIITKQFSPGTYFIQYRTKEGRLIGSERFIRMHQ